MKENLESDFVKKMIYDELVDIVGADNVSISQVDKICYSRDAWPQALMLIDMGKMLPPPDFVVHVENKEQISKILRLANTKKIPVIPFAGGAGACGQIIPVQGGIILDVKKMDKILRIDEISATVTAQPGIIGEDLERELNKASFTTGHFPASQYTSCLGGFVACRSAGSLSSKYGKIEDMVISMEVVLPNGEIMRTKTTPRSSTGPNLNQLFIGSEGTLGVITEVTLRLHPLPEERRFKAFIMKDLKTGLETVRQIFRKGLKPAVIRLYDELDTVFTLKGKLELPPGACYLILAFDGVKEIVDFEDKITTEIVVKNEGKEVDKQLAEYWWNHRYDMYFPHPDRQKMGLVADTIDVVTTWDKLEDLYYGVKEAIIAKYPSVFIMSHFSHFYPEGGSIYIIFAYQEPDREKALKTYIEIWDLGLEACHKIGGSVAHHHGVGLSRAKWMRKEYGEAGFKALEAIKKALDPNNIMNPGKMGFEAI
ncbi:MAG: FAD-binding oxidoreductase [Candidatus Jordarchaeum sp.]|uniref:FAD-binding oxidoreductase n=1 Tax=Candidatus Jordarchaeum sp. TaxID=2823881 RepID=UPI00404B1ADF